MATFSGRWLRLDLIFATPPNDRKRRKARESCCDRRRFDVPGIGVPDNPSLSNHGRHWFGVDHRTIRGELCGAISQAAAKSPSLAGQSDLRAADQQMSF